MHKLSDYELAIRAQGGEAESFGLLYTRYKDWVYGYVLRHVPNSEIAVDLVQDIFLKALEGLARLEPGSNFGAWLNGITRHVVMDYLRGYYRRKADTEALTENSATLPQLEEAIFSRQELEQILLNLSLSYQTIIRLRIIEGRSNEEVARKLYGEDSEENRHKVSVSLYRAIQAARAVAKDFNKKGANR